MSGERSPPSWGASLPGWSLGAEEGPAGDPGPRYQREGVLGAGGMGRVFLARDLELGREVAIKEANSLATAAALQREARTLGRLEHPGIVAVHDVGMTESGLPWVAMRLVRGRTLAEVVAAAPDAAGRLAAVLHVRDAAHAVAYAHGQGVLHRDLKPDNVLIGAHGETQVVDWGVAAEVGNVPRGIAGTPRFMAPEALSGGPVDERVDVWGLGVLLHHVLTGGPLRVADGPDSPVRPVGEGAPAELAAVAARCLEREPGSRYPTAGDVADELDRYLTGGRVLAHAYGPTELLVRFVRAWRGPLAAAALVLALGAAGLLVVNRQLASERDRALDAEEGAREALAVAQVVAARGALEAGETADAGALGAAALAYREDPDARGAAVAAWSDWRVTRRLGPSLADCPGAVPLFDGRLCHDGARVWREGEDGARRWTTEVAVVSMTVAGTRVATQDAVTATVLRLADGGIEGSYPRRSPLPLVGTPDGRFASRRWEGESWSGSLDPQGVRRLYTGCDGRGRPRQADLHPARELHVAACGDGVLAVTMEDGRVQTVPLGRAVSEHGDVAAVRWSPDTAQIALVWYRGGIGWYDVPSGALTIADRASASAGLAVAPGGSLLAVLGERGEVEIWTTAPLARVVALPGRSVASVSWEGPTVLRTLGVDDARWTVIPRPIPPVVPVGLGVSDLAWTHDGAQLFAALSDGVLVAVPARAGVPGFRREVGRGVLMSVFPTADDRSVVVAPGEEMAYYAVPRDGGPPQTVGRAPAGRFALPLRDGGLLVSDFMVGLRRGSGSSWEDPGCFPAEWRSAHRGPFTDLLVSVDGRVARARDGRCEAEIRGVRASRAAIAPDESWWVASTTAELQRRSFTGEVAWARPIRAAEVSDLDVSPDGRWVAVAGRNGLIFVLDALTGASRATLRGHRQRIGAIAFAPDGARLASGGWDGSVRVWDLGLLDAPADKVAAAFADRGWPSVGAALQGR